MAKHVDSTGQLDDGRLTDEADSDANVLDRKRFSAISSAAALVAAIVVALGGLAGWLGYQTYEARRDQHHRDLVIETARQAAVNLTTIRFNEVERDIERVLESSTGKFHDDFQARSEPFVEAVKQAQSKSEGTVTAAGITSQTAAQTDVLVAVSVKTTVPGTAEQPPRSWRLRISVEMRDNAAKVSDVQFVA